jgi:hypothetical protein
MTSSTRILGLAKIAAALAAPMAAFFDDRVEFLASDFGRELLYEIMALEPHRRAHAVHALAIMGGIAEPAVGRLKTAACPSEAEKENATTFRSNAFGVVGNLVLLNLTRAQWQ